MASGKYLKNKDRQRNNRSRNRNKHKTNTKKKNQETIAKSRCTVVKNGDTVSVPFLSDITMVDYNPSKTTEQIDKAANKTSRMDFSNSITKSRKQAKQKAKQQEAAIDWKRVEELKIEAAERDGLITGVIVLIMMAIMCCLYMTLSSYFPAISPQVLSGRVLSVLMNFIVGMATGGYQCYS